MSELILVVGSLLGLVLARIWTLAWNLFKLLMFIMILMGGLSAVFLDRQLWVNPEDVWYLQFFDAVEHAALLAHNHWMELAILMLFLWMISIRSKIEKIEINTSASKIGTVTVMSYLNIEVQTEVMQKLREEGILASVKFSAFLRLFGFLFGFKDVSDDALTAKAIRAGTTVTFEEDLDHKIGNMSKTIRGTHYRGADEH